MKKLFSIALSIAAAVALSASAYAASDTQTTAGPTGDIAKIYRVKHELKFDLQGNQAKLDGKAVTADKPILKNGRKFMPLRTLRQAGAATEMTWNAAKREVYVAMNSRLQPAWKELRFRIGSDQVFGPDGTALSGMTIPKPFISNGITTRRSLYCTRKTCTRRKFYHPWAAELGAAEPTK